MGPGMQSQIFTGYTAMTKWKYESKFSEQNPGVKSVWSQTLSVVFVYFVLDELQE